MKARSVSVAIQKSSNFRIFIIGAFFLSILLIAILSGTGFSKAAQFPYCNDVPVEHEIIRDFNWAEDKTWQRGVKMVGLTKAHQHRVVQYDGSPVIRRYCMAQAHLSNGRHHSIYYIVENIGGFVGKQWNVTHCVIGLDPWRNHDGACRTLR